MPKLKPGNHWRYKYKKNLTISENLCNLLKQLSTNNIVVATEENLQNSIAHKYTIKSMGMPGDLDYVQNKLHAAYNYFKAQTELFVSGEETDLNKKWQLKSCQHQISQSIFFNHEMIELGNDSNHFKIYNKKTFESKEINITQIKNLEIFRASYVSHINLRNKYLSLLYEFLQNLVDFLEQISLAEIVLKPSKNKATEMQLLEIWTAIASDEILSGYSQKDKTTLRKKFLELFGIIDRNYSDKKKNFYDRNEPGSYLQKLATSMKNQYKKIRKKKK
jgi:hypothetical protein